jgi:hypothetical protein
MASTSARLSFWKTTENLARAERESRRMYRQMEAAYAERISFGGPLA